MRSIVLVGLMVVAFLALAVVFNIPAGVFGLIGLAGWILEKPLQLLSDRLAAYAAKLRAEIEQEKAQCRS